MSATTKPSDSTAWAGRRRHHFAALPATPKGRANVGSPRRNRPNSFANSQALPYRRCGSFSRHLRQILSRSRGIPELSTRGAMGSWLSTSSSVSVIVAAWNGARPVRRWYSVASRP
jgi:hypothetical protein